MQYREWESTTKELYEKYAAELRTGGMIADAIYVDELVEDVDKELKCLERIMVDLISTGYDMTYIVESQKDIHDKYRDKLKEVGKYA